MTAVDFAAFVERLAQASSEVIIPFFRTSIRAEDKSKGGVFDPVTEADRAAEVAMRRLIGQTFPAHGVIGEEYGQDRPDAEYVWVLDPIDGTKSFISGLPMWGTLIGLMHRGRPMSRATRLASCEAIANSAALNSFHRSDFTIARSSI